MPSIDFYFISAQGVQARLLFACRLLEKAYQQKHQIFVLLQDLEKAQLLDKLLWTFRDESFIPHQLLFNTQETSAPIQISYQAQLTTHQDILLNLYHPIPDCHQHFNRLLEIITQEPSMQEIAKEHHEFYAKKGYKISLHHLNQ